MQKTWTFLFLISCNWLCAQKTYEYPVASQDAIFDHYFDTTIHDPYQWMENPADPRLEEWLEGQKRITKKLSNQQTLKQTLRAQIGSIYNDVQEKTLDGYVSKEKSELSKYEFDFKHIRYDRYPDLLFRLRDKSNYRMLLKSKDFTRGKNDHIRITDRWVNEKYDLAAIEISHNGSDWRDVYFFDLITGRQLPDSLNFLRAGSKLIWDEKNVYYDSYTPPEEGRELLNIAKGQSLYYHKLGTSQAEDKRLYQNPDTTGTNSFSFRKMDGKIFFYHFYPYKSKILRAISYANEDPESFFLKNFLIYPNTDSIYVSIESVLGDTILMQTNWNTPKGSVLMANINELNKPSQLVPEYDVSLREVNKLGKEHIACIYREGARNVVLIFNLKGELIRKVDFPEGKKLNHFYENSDDVLYTDFSISSFYHPPLWYQLSLKDFTFKPSESLSVPYDPNSLETRYVKYPSKDGTMIPMYITCLKSTKLNGKNPTLLYGYGGYGTTVEPRFNQSQALWLLHGGILAIPNIRGGGAEGSDWGRAGRGLNKQNAIDDFIAAAEFMKNEKYTNPEKLAIQGGSHGGLLVGAVITQRPELFKAAIAEAGAFEMLRFEQFTVGSAALNINEFGSVSNQSDFENLLSYSPLHQVKKGVAYPNVLLITGDSDDRVPPLHSYKFLAKLQANGDPKKLYHLYLIEGAGHSGALTSETFVDVLLYKSYFLFDQLQLRFY